jgi:Flp pilus assembly protein TadD
MKLRTQLIILFFALANVYSQSGNDNRISAYGCLKSGKYNEAISAFASLTNTTIHDKLSLGIAQFYSQDFTTARKNFQLADKSGIAEANLWIAKIIALNRNSKDVIFYIERYLKSSKNPDIIAIQKDTSFRFVHESDAWFDLWQNDWYSENQKILQETMFFVNRKNYKAAHQLIESAISLNNTNPEFFLYNSTIYLAENNPALALNEINQALTLDPSNNDYLQNRARCNIQLNDFDAALEDLNQLVSNDPTDFENRKLRAQTAMEAKDFELAENDISIYLQFFDKEEDIFLAGQISYAAENYLSALKYFNKLMQEAKPNPSYFKARGLTYYQSNNYSLASNDLSMSLDLDPLNGETNFYMGLSQHYLGNKKAACYFWKRAKEYGEIRSIEYLQKYCK